LNNLLESTLKRQMSYLRGGTITETIMAYNYGFLITVIVNSVISVGLSTLVNQYYWIYTYLKKEFHLISKYIDRIRKRKSRNNFAIKLDDYKKEDDANDYSPLNSRGKGKGKGKGKGNKKTCNLGSQLKI